MAPTLDDTLQEASLDGVAFPFITRRNRGGNSYGRDEYPYRAGQDAEHTGRNKYVIELEIPLYNGVEWPTELWPALWDELRGVLEDPERRGLHEFVDPASGPIPVIAVDWTEELDAERRDGITLHLVLEERQLDTGTFAIRPDRDPSGLAERLATALDEASAAAGLDDDDIATAFEAYGVGLTDEDPVELGGGSVMSSLVGDFTSALAESALAQDAIGAKLDELRSRVDAIRLLPATQNARNFALLYSCERLIATVADVAETARAKSRPVQAYRVRDLCSVYEIAAELYGDAQQVDDILARNHVPDPLFIPGGTVLQVLVAAA